MGTLKLLMAGEVFVSLVMNRRRKNSSLTFTKVDIYARIQKQKVQGLKEAKGLLQLCS